MVFVTLGTGGKDRVGEIEAGRADVQGGHETSL